MAILKEFIVRINIVFICLIIFWILEIGFVNELVLLMLNPISLLNNDWHNNIAYEVINKAFTIYDVDDILDVLSVCYVHNVDYTPSCEIGLRNAELNDTFTYVFIHSMLIPVYATVSYQGMLYCLPSMYIYEKWTTIYKIAHILALICLAIVIAHNMWTLLYMNVSFNAYKEHNYYEFDVIFDIHDYISRYIDAIYVHLYIFILCRHSKYLVVTKTSIVILCIVQYIYIVETIYYILLIYCFYELHTFSCILHLRLHKQS